MTTKKPSTNRSRREGRIKALKREGTPQIIISLDTETHIIEIDKDNVVLPFKLGVATVVHLDKEANLLDRKVVRFKDKKSFIDLLVKTVEPRKTTYIIGHNIGFDIRVLSLTKLFKELNTESTPPIINERVFMWSGKINNCRFEFIDTANFAVHSVEQLGKDLKFAKMSIDFNNCTEEELFDYCQRDTEICEKFFIEYIKFIRINELGEFRPTLASQSLTAFRKKFMHTPYYIHNDETVIALEREAYHGGKVEAFKLGQLEDQLYWYLDVNSMYPYVMLNKEMPVRKVGYTKKCSMDYLKRMVAKAYVIADVLIDTDKPIYPIIKNGKLIFHVGKFRATLHQSELEYALEHNHIVGVKQVAVYEKKIIFDDYVKFFYGIKQQSSIDDNQSWRFISKIFLNSLYGKTGQSYVGRKNIGTCDDKLVFRHVFYSQPTKEWMCDIHWDGIIYREEKGGEVAHSFPALAGAVTAEARMLLTRYIEKAGWENTFYVDTDSLICNQTGIEALSDDLSETTLGKLKIEDVSHSVNIRGCKDYSFGIKDRIKGVSSKAQKITENRWRYLQMTGFISWMNEGNQEEMKGIYREKNRSGIYYKGNVDEFGNITPIRLEDF